MNSEHGAPTTSSHDTEPSPEETPATKLAAADPASPNDSTSDSTPDSTNNSTNKPAGDRTGYSAGDAAGTSSVHRPGPVKIKHTRTAGTWAAVVVAIIALVVLLVFILQNGQSVTVTVFGAVATLPLGVAMLMSAAIGGLLVALIGTARILQLRRTARRPR